MYVMEENLMSSLKSAKDSLDELQGDISPQEYSESSLLRLSSALKNIDNEINKLRNVINVDLNSPS